MKLLAIFLVCVFASKINGNAFHYCSNKLYEKLEELCGNRYNDKFDKGLVTSQSAKYVIESDFPYPYASSSLDNVFQDEADNSLAEPRPVRKEGITDECCLNACTDDQLKLYCKSTH